MMTRLAYVLAFICLIFGGAFALAVDIDIAELKEKAVKWTRKAADQGHAEAQFRMGFAYANGHGVIKDDVEAVKWFHIAAEQGHAGAQFNLGVMYGGGRGAAKDEVEAAKWRRKAAEQGLWPAQLNMAFAYSGGHGVIKDNVEALAWMLVASWSEIPGEAQHARRGLGWGALGMTRAQKDEAIKLAHELQAKIKSAKDKKK